jgi:hypothetical protein
MDPRIVPIERIRKEMRKQKQARERGPRELPDGVEQVFAVYQWIPRWRRWNLLGFARRKQVMRRRRLARWRKKAKVADGCILKFVDLFIAQRTGGPREAYVPQRSLRPDEVNC